jgi:hypothetical protein
MKEIKDIIELQTNSRTEKLSFATRYLVQINFTFDLSVVSNRFAGTSHFCVRKDEIESLCNDLEKMQSTLSGSSKLNDNHSDGFVEFIIFKNGGLQVHGQVGGSHEEHFVKFEFQTDQTCIPRFVGEFRNLLKYNDEEWKNSSTNA